MRKSRVGIKRDFDSMYSPIRAKANRVTEKIWIPVASDFHVVVAIQNNPNWNTKPRNFKSFSSK